MRVLICPDAVAPALTGALAADAVAAGWISVAPRDDLDRRPLSDGGPGFVDAIERAVEGKRIPVDTVDPLGRPVAAEILVAGDVAYIEGAQAIGAHLLGEGEHDPRRTSSAGLGPLIRAALGMSVAEIVLGLAGSSCNDAGAGMLAALGAEPRAAGGAGLEPGGAALRDCTELAGRVRLDGIRLTGATDETCPLTGLFGTSAVYGPAKGASRADVLALDAALERFASVLVDYMPTSPADLPARPGAGAGGGIGAAVLALGGRLASARAFAWELASLDAALDGADLVITATGELDAFRLRESPVATVAAGARDRGLPCVVLAAANSAGRRETLAAGITDVYALAEPGTTDPVDALAALGARLARQWSA